MPQSGRKCVQSGGPEVLLKPSRAQTVPPTEQAAHMSTAPSLRTPLETAHLSKRTQGVRSESHPFWKRVDVRVWGVGETWADAVRKCSEAPSLVLGELVTGKTTTSFNLVQPARSHCYSVRTPEGAVGRRGPGDCQVLWGWPCTWGPGLGKHRAPTFPLHLGSHLPSPARHPS